MTSIVRRPLTPRRVGAAVVAAVAVATTGYAVEARQAGGEQARPLGPGEVTIRLGIEHSLFDADEIRVVEGTRLRFVVDNTDPIAHELIVGDAEVHARHEAGTHPVHPPVPGEVSVEANARAVTTFRFDEPGTVEFACHLPRHYDFGMRGEVVVVPRRRGVIHGFGSRRTQSDSASYGSVDEPRPTSCDPLSCSDDVAAGQ